MNKKLRLEELNRIGVEEYKSLPKFPIVVILDDIRSGFNIGSIFRTADALALEKIYLCGITAQPPHREIYKTALGATESVQWEYSANIVELIEQLKLSGYKIISLEQVENSIALNQFSSADTSKFALVVGNEVDGVRQEVVDKSDYCLEIPQYGTKHSLNVSVSTGMALWEMISKIKKA